MDRVKKAEELTAMVVKTAYQINLPKQWSTTERMLHVTMYMHAWGHLLTRYLIHHNNLIGPHMGKNIGGGGLRVMMRVYT